VTDRFGSGTITLLPKKRLCNPANIDEPAAEARDAVADSAHLTGYIVQTFAPKFAPVTRQTVVNRFGTTRVNVVKPSLLLVPSAKSLTGPPDPLATRTLDRFLCYRVIGARTRAGSIPVVDQFGTMTLKVQRPFRLCTAVDVNGDGVLEPAASLLCYLTSAAPGSPTFRGPTDLVFVDDDFGPEAVIVNHVRELCVPSIINP